MHFTRRLCVYSLAVVGFTQRILVLSLMHLFGWSARSDCLRCGLILLFYRALYDNEHRTDINEGRFHKHGHLLFFPRDIPSGASTTLVLLSNISSPNGKCKGVDVHATPIRASVPNLSMQATQGTFSRYARRSILLHATHQRLDRLRSICVGNYPTLAPNCCQALYANKVDSYYRNVSGIVARR